MLLRTGAVPMTGALQMGSSKITSLGAPVAASDAATKAYVDSQVSGTFPHAACACASTANINLATGGLLTIDGVTVLAGDRVLVKNQTTPSQNGIYIAAVGAWTATNTGLARVPTGPVTSGTAQRLRRHQCAILRSAPI
jgi:hypothetical protein